jgi:hypothetical protein
MNKITQGAMANKNGRTVENMMIPLFEASGFKVVKHKEINSNIGDRYVIKNAPYTSIYNHKAKTEFVIVNGERRIRIESKYQSVAGSVDEKFPYMMYNAIYTYPEKEVIFVIDGGGCKVGAKEWLQNQIKSYSGEKIIKLMDLKEFVNWFNHEF